MLAISARECTNFKKLSHCSKWESQLLQSLHDKLTKLEDPPVTPSSRWSGACIDLCAGGGTRAGTGGTGAGATGGGDLSAKTLEPQIHIMQYMIVYVYTV